MAQRLFTNPFFLLLLPFALASSIFMHHFIICGRWVDWGDILHHEFFAFTSIAFGIGILVTVLIIRGGHGRG